MPRLILFCSLILALTACDRVPVPRIGFLARDVPSEPLPFDARIEAARGAESFAVAVDGRGQGLEVLRESVRFEGTRHCLRSFGTSDIDWAAAPGRPEAWIGRSDGRGRTVYTGRCRGR